MGYKMNKGVRKHIESIYSCNSDHDITYILTKSKRIGIYLNDYLTESLKHEQHNEVKVEWDNLCNHFHKVITDRCESYRDSYFPFQFDLYFHDDCIFIYQIEQYSRYLIFVYKLEEFRNGNLLNLLNKRVEKLEKRKKIRKTWIDSNVHRKRQSISSIL